MKMLNFGQTLSKLVLEVEEVIMQDSTWYSVESCSVKLKWTKRVPL